MPSVPITAVGRCSIASVLDRVLEKLFHEY